MQMIKGQTVVLHVKTQTSVDAFGMPIFTDATVNVPNVVISPTTDTELLSEMQLYGKKSIYTLCIPKGDANDWDDCKVEFFGNTWKTFGPITEYQEELVPLSWNKKVKVERYE